MPASLLQLIEELLGHAGAADCINVQIHFNTGAGAFRQRVNDAPGNFTLGDNVSFPVHALLGGLDGGNLCLIKVHAVGQSFNVCMRFNTRRGKRFQLLQILA